MGFVRWVIYNFSSWTHNIDVLTHSNWDPFFMTDVFYVYEWDSEKQWPKIKGLVFEMETIVY